MAKVNDDVQAKDELRAQSEFLRGGITSGFLGGREVRELVGKAAMVSAIAIPVTGLLGHVFGHPIVPFGSEAVNCNLDPTYTCLPTAPLC